MRPPLARETRQDIPLMSPSAHLLVVTWDIVESASAGYAVKLALARSRRREAVVFFLTDGAVSAPLGPAHRAAIDRMVASGARVLVDARLVGTPPTLAEIPGVETASDDDLADLLFTSDIDARWS